MNKPDLHILIIEDEPFDVELIKDQLTLLEDYNCILKVVGDKQSFLIEMNKELPEIILSDYNLPQFTGMDALKEIKSRNLSIPFIFVTGTMSEEIAVGTIKEGAWDYVVKDRLFRLPFAIRSVLKLKDEKIVADKAEAQNQLLLASIEQTSSQVIVCSINGNIEYVNRQFSEITGFSTDEVRGKNVFQFFSEDNSSGINNAALTRINNREIIRGERMTRNPEGSEFWQLYSITPIENQSGKITNFVIIIEDITRLKKMEQELIESRDRAELSDKLKDAFLQNLSHEIRTPLNAIVGFSNILNTEDELTKENLSEYTSIICDSSNHLLSIVTDILTMASIQTGQETLTIKPLNVNKLFDQIYDIFQPLAAKKGLDFKLIKGEEDMPLFVMTDETKLTQIISNLLNNAIKFTSKGNIILKYTVANDIINYSVADTGIGISKESQDLIFERFRQEGEYIRLNYGGTGLGLSISKSFTQMLGGKLEVKSETGTGSVFTLSLPYSPFENQSAPKKPEKITAPDNEILILIAEDELNNYLLLKAFLNIPKIKILYAKNGLEAVDICESNKVDLILMDIKMPVMDGISAFIKIREKHKKIPVIAQTAYSLENEKQEFLNLGFNDYISKPISKEVLYSTITKTLSKTTIF